MLDAKRSQDLQARVPKQSPEQPVRTNIAPSLLHALEKQHSIKHKFLNKVKGFIKQGNNKISMADLVKLLLRDPGNCCALPGTMEQQINCNCLDFHQSVPSPALSSV